MYQSHIKNGILCKCKWLPDIFTRTGQDTNLFQINIISQLHVLSVDLQDFQSSCGIRNTNVHLSVKAACKRRE